MKKLLLIFALLALQASARDYRITWNGDNYPATITFEVWSSTDMVNWVKIGETPLSEFPMKADKPREFFKVRARDLLTGDVSDWATK